MKIVFELRISCTLPVAFVSLKSIRRKDLESHSSLQDHLDSLNRPLHVSVGFGISGKGSDVQKLLIVRKGCEVVRIKLRAVFGKKDFRDSVSADYPF